jgi:hypothetical protein
MTDPFTRLAALRRPRLLLQAARHGLREYRRERRLRRLLPGTIMPGTALPDEGAAVAPLLEVEAQLEEARRARDAGYSPARHVEVLIALVAEARALAPGAEAPHLRLVSSG